MHARGLAFGLTLAVSAPCGAAIAMTHSPPAAVAFVPRAPLPALVAPSLPARPVQASRRARTPVPVYHPARPAFVLRPGAAPPVFRSLPVREPVVFLTIDDGWFPDARVASLARAGVPLTAFLVSDAVHRFGPYYDWLARDGARIENHTMSHPFLPRMSLQAQTREICRPIAGYMKAYGARPHLFRPPYGAYNVDTLRAVRACGLGAVFMWNAEMKDGRLTTSPSSLRAGDIVLLHFRPELYDELMVLFRYLRARHLGVGSLEEYIVPLGAPRAS